MNTPAYADNLPLMRQFLRSNGIQGAFFEKIEAGRWAVYEGPRPLGVRGFLVDTYRTKREAAAMTAAINAAIRTLVDHDHAIAAQEHAA